MLATTLVFFPSFAFAFQLTCSGGVMTSSRNVKIGETSADCAALALSLHFTDAKMVYACGQSSTGAFNVFNAYTGKEFAAASFKTVAQCAASLKHAVAAKAIICAPASQGFTSVNLQTEEVGASFGPTASACLAKVANARPTPVQALKIGTQFNLWSSKATTVGYTLKMCEDPRSKFHIVGQAPDGGRLAPQCAPDTLYSWGDTAKVNWFMSNLGGGSWPGALSRELFLSQSPSGSFGYGQWQMRMKIKPGVQFRLRRNEQNRPCSSVSADEAANSIYVISWYFNGNDGVDYVICNSSVIESWSFGTREGFDEVARDANWVNSHKLGQYSLYAKTGSSWWYPGQTQQRSENGDVFSEATLERNLKSWAEVASQGKDVIYYNAGVPHTRARHFQTAHPIYYNPN